MTLKEKIIQIYPSLSEEDIGLKDDGYGVVISYWNSTEPKPSDEQVRQWELLILQQYEVTQQPSVEKKLVQMEQDVADLWYSVMMGGLL